jgi:hypothetical protein
MVMRGGGRPMAPMAPRANVNPLAGALAPFYAPRGNSEANSEAVYQLFMPLLANMRPHARAPPPVDPNVLPAVTTMISKALPDPAKTSPLEASVAYGGMLAGMGGVRGLRGHSLKRIHGLPPATAAGVPDPASLPILGTEGAMFSIPGGVYPGPAVGAKADDQQAGAKDGKGGGD